MLTELYDIESDIREVFDLTIDLIFASQYNKNKTKILGSRLSNKTGSIILLTNISHSGLDEPFLFSFTNENSLFKDFCWEWLRQQVRMDSKCHSNFDGDIKPGFKITSYDLDSVYKSNLPSNGIFQLTPVSILYGK